MQAVLIDPFERKLSVVEWQDYKDWYKLIDCETFDMPRLAPVTPKHSLGLVVDDNGIFREGQRFFRIVFRPTTTFAGKALVVLNDDEGETRTLPAPELFIE